MERAQKILFCIAFLLIGILSTLSLQQHRQIEKMKRDQECTMSLVLNMAGDFYGADEQIKESDLPCHFH